MQLEKQSRKSQMGPYYKYGIESMVEEDLEETPLQNQGIFSILAKPTYKGVL
jgi:beta-xylosidase